MMSIANPLTVSTDIARADAASGRLPRIDDETKSSFGKFSGDIVEISSLGRERLQIEKQLQTNKQIANEVVSVSSTIGRNSSTGNLSQTQATELYNKIASLL